MPRHPRAVPYDQFKVSLPPELSAELRLRCFSPIHVYGAPKGAISALFEIALREYFETHPFTPEAEGNEQQADPERSPGEGDIQP